MLIQAGIIREDRKKRLRLTNRGSVVGTYLDRGFYSEACKEMLGLEADGRVTATAIRDLPDVDWTTYWKLTNTTIEYDRYVAHLPGVW